MILGSMH